MEGEAGIPTGDSNRAENVESSVGLLLGELDKRIGLSATHRKLLLSLLALPREMANAIRFGQSTRKAGSQTGLTLKHAWSLYLLRKHRDKQQTLYKKLLFQQASANEALRAVRGERQEKNGNSSTIIQDPNVQLALDRLRYKLGSKVQIRKRGRVGELVIEFYGDQDLVRIYDLLVGATQLTVR